MQRTWWCGFLIDIFSGAWTNPSEKPWFIVKMGSSSPKIGDENRKHVSCHHLVFYYFSSCGRVLGNFCLLHQATVITLHYYGRLLHVLHVEMSLGPQMSQMVCKWTVMYYSRWRTWKFPLRLEIGKPFIRTLNRPFWPFSCWLLDGKFIPSLIAHDFWSPKTFPPSGIELTGFPSRKQLEHVV